MLFSPEDWNVGWKNFSSISSPCNFKEHLLAGSQRPPLVPWAVSAGAGKGSPGSPSCWFPSLHLPPPGTTEVVTVWRSRCPPVHSSPEMKSWAVMLAEARWSSCQGKLKKKKIYNFKKEMSYNQNKKQLWRGTWNGFICCHYLPNVWKEIKQMNEERQGDMVTWMQPLVQEVLTNRWPKGRRRWGKENKSVIEESPFSLFPTSFVPSLARSWF